MESVVLPGAGAANLGAEEIFFSTTDRRGVIRQGNSVFARISGYPIDKLLGAPHNIVRHPDMPAGAFHIMWDLLQAGEPAGTYVCNLTESGEPYWVSAMVVPAHDGYLSVRIAPLTAGLEIVRGVYADAREAEQIAHSEGLSRRDVAARGAQVIVHGLAQRGFSSYPQFMQAFVPAELASRQIGALGRHRRPTATGSLSHVLAATHDLASELSRVIGALTTYQQLGNELAATATQVLKTTSALEESVTAAQAASDQVTDKIPVLANVAAVMAAPMREGVTELRMLPGVFSRLHESIQRLRFQIAQAALYNDAVAAFAAEVWDGAAPVESLSAVPLLVDVATPCVHEMAIQIDQVNADLRQVSVLVADAGTHLQDFRRMIGRWRQLVMRHAPTQLGHSVAPVDAAITATWAAAEELTQLGERGSAAILDFNAGALRDHLGRMRQGAAASVL